LEAAWADIVTRHPDVIPDPVIIIKSDKRAWGHMTVGRTWAESLPEGTEGPVRRYHEIMVSAELLAQHPVRVFQTLLHEAAHTVAVTRKIQDTSRQNRYHNSRFRELAEELGLTWAHVEPETIRVPGTKFRTVLLDVDSDSAYDEDGFPFFEVESGPDATIGYSDMSITRETAEAYADTIVNISEGVKVEHTVARTTVRAPRKRTTICMVATGGNVHLPAVDREEASEILGHVVEDEKVQRIGCVVYEGLLTRGLLADGLVIWTEKV
jgi:hypothetical protein